MKRALFAILVIGCSKTDPVEQKAAMVPVSELPASLAPPALPAPVTPPGEEFSVASFRKGVLDECLDAHIIYGPEVTDEVKAGVRSALQAADKKGSKVTVLTKPCGEQFADRAELATCSTVEDGTTINAKIFLVATYYNVSTVQDSDAYMQNCLEKKGNWKAAAKDDRAAARSRLQQRLRQLQNDEL